MLGCLPLALACSLNPVTQRPQVVLSTRDSERAAGEQGAEAVARELGLVTDARLVASLEAIGRRLAEHAPAAGPDYRFALVDRAAPNAFALPGGWVYVSRGLVALCNREDELANAIAHEMVHVAARHHGQRSTRAAGLGILALPALLAGAILPGRLGELVTAPFAVVGVGVLAAHGRSQEREADRFGQRLVAAAGWDPAALADFLEGLDRLEGLEEGEERMPGFFDTHPSTPSRVEEARREARAIQWRAGPRVVGDRDAWLHHVEGLLLGENPAEGVFDGHHFLHPDLDLSLVFPTGWTTRNSHDAVGAVAPDGSAEVSLRAVGRGDDPGEAASAFLDQVSRETRVEVARTEAFEIAGRDAVRIQAVAGGRGGPVGLDLTWIAHDGRMLLLAGVVPRGYRDEHREIFGRTARSFRPLDAAERAGMREWRLRLREAREGESIGAFVGRTGSRWSARRTAVENGLAVGARLHAGQLLKVALEEPYGGGRQ